MYTVVKNKVFSSYIVVDASTACKIIVDYLHGIFTNTAGIRFDSQYISLEGSIQKQSDFISSLNVLAVITYYCK
jgi:hypothetical protein